MKSHDLHDLIHSLTPAEKGYFKKFISLHGKGEKKYVKLFDAINAQKAHNEEAIKKKLGKEISNLSMAKGHLYDMVLQAMHVFESGKRFLPKFNRLMEDGLFLDDRDLNRAAASRYEAAYRLADDSWSPQLALFAYFEWVTILRSANMNEQIPSLANYEAEAMRLLNEATGSADSRFLYRHLGDYETKAGRPNTVTQLNEYKRIAEIYLERLQKNEKSAIAQYKYNTISAYNEARAGNQLKAIRHALECIRLVHNNLVFQKSELNGHIIIYSNIMFYCLRLQHWDNYQKAVKKLKSEMERWDSHLTPSIRNTLEVNLVSSETRYYMVTSQQSLAKPAAVRLRHWIDNQASSAYFRDISRAKSTEIEYYLSTGDKQKVISLCNQFLYGKEEFPEANYADIHVILLLYLIEDRDHDRIKQQIAHAKKYTGERNNANEVFYLVIAFAEKVLKKKNAGNYKGELEELKRQQAKLKITSTASPLLFFNIDAWIQSQLEGTSYDKEIRKIWKQQSAEIKASTEAQLKELNLTWDDLKLPEWYWKE